MKKIKLTLICLLLLLLATLLMTEGCDKEKSLYNENAKNIESANFTNSSGTITYKDHVYYTKCRSDDIKYDLYRLNINTMEEEKIKDEVILMYGIINERIIFTDFDEPFFEEINSQDGLYSMDLNGRNIVKVVENGSFSKIFQIEDNIYAISSQGYLCKIDINSKSYNQVYEEELYYPYILEHTIYYIKYNAETNEENIWMLNVKNFTEEQITYSDNNVDLKKIVVFDEDIYCLVGGDGGTAKFGKFDDDKKTINYLLEERPVINQELIICGDYIVFACIGGTYKVKIGTDKVEKIFWKSSKTITSINGHFSLLSNKKRIDRIYSIEGEYINRIEGGYYKGNGAMYRELLEKQREEMKSH